jgi:adenylylsulfate kinase-like enzyme
MIYWFTGQPGAGKTSIAKSLMEKLPNNTFHVDGDDLREIFNNKDYSETGRRKNIELAQHITHFLHNKGNNVVVSLVSPYRDQREDFKNNLNNTIIEIYVHTEHIRGREDFHVKNYEEPLEDFLDMDTSDILISKCVENIIDYEKLYRESRQEDINNG